jgi:hypothetical protein
MLPDLATAAIENRNLVLEPLRAEVSVAPPTSRFQ